MINHAVPVCAKYLGVRKFCRFGGRLIRLLSCKNAACPLVCGAHSRYIGSHISARLRGKGAKDKVETRKERAAGGRLPEPGHARTALCTGSGDRWELLIVIYTCLLDIRVLR